MNVCTRACAYVCVCGCLHVFVGAGSRVMHMCALLCVCENLSVRACRCFHPTAIAPCPQVCPAPPISLCAGTAGGANSSGVGPSTASFGAFAGAGPQGQSSSGGQVLAGRKDLHVNIPSQKVQA